jgi:hypothetical protein
MFVTFRSCLLYPSLEVCNVLHAAANPAAFIQIVAIDFDNIPADCCKYLDELGRGAAPPNVFPVNAMAPEQDGLWPPGGLLAGNF